MKAFIRDTKTRYYVSLDSVLSHRFRGDDDLSKEGSSLLCHTKTNRAKKLPFNFWPHGCVYTLFTPSFLVSLCVYVLSSQRSSTRSVYLLYVA